MSKNISVQKATQRRAGPPDTTYRGPQSSIKSTAVFSQQGYGQQQQGYGQPQTQGPRQSVGGYVNGQPNKSQYIQEQQPPQTEGIGNISKMTMAQAITLITLRLGAVESKLLELSQENNTLSSVSSHDGMILMDKDVIQSISTRLETLEKRNTVTTPATVTTNSSEVTLLKQQLEGVKQILGQTKNTTLSIVKENKELKLQLETFKQELTESKELLTALQNLSIENNQQLILLNDKLLIENHESYLLETDEVLESNQEFENNPDLDTSELINGELELDLDTTETLVN